MKKTLSSILMSAYLINMPSAIQESPKDSYCSRGYWGIQGVFYVDVDKNKVKLVETYEFELLRCLEWKLEEQKETNGIYR